MTPTTPTSHPASPAGTATNEPRAGLRLALRSIGIGAVAFAACMLAWWLAHQRSDLLGLWPAAGVAFGFGWRLGVAGWLPAALGSGLWAAIVLGGPVAGMGLALSTGLGPALALLALKRINDWKPSEYRLESALRLIIAITGISALVCALIATVTLGSTPALETVPAVKLFFSSWLLESFGALVVVPAVVAAAPSVRGRWVAPGPLLAAAVIIGTTLLLSALTSFGSAPALLSFIVPVAGWIAIRGQERETAWTMLLMMTAMVTLRASEIARAGDAAHPLVETVILGTVTALVVLLLQSVAADRRIALRRVAQQARQDMSTGLLNDRGLLAEFGERLAAEHRPHYGLVGLHLTNFDTLNDLCGPMPAIQLEQSVAALLQRQPGLQAAARLSAGRYALLIETDSLSEVRAVAREIYATVSGQVFRTVNGSIRLQSCVGGLLIDREAQINSEDCLVSLSEAQAIAASVREPQLFVEPLSQSMIDARRAHQSKIEKIRESIHEHRFQVHAQEIVDSQAPVGKLSYEVLIRLLDERGGLVKPPEFMSLAVQAQMTPAMDRGVIERVFGWLAAHPEAMARTHKCSINLSGLTMSDGTIASFIREQRIRHGIPPEIIVFEITESEAIRNPSAASRLVDELKADGFGIALDDFGVGLATFEYLKRFPIDFLKIDGSFVRNLINNPIDEEIVLSTVRVARRLNVQTVAEHVQDQAVYDRLLSLGVGHFQGEHLGRVMPIDELFRRPEPAGGKTARGAVARTAPATGP